MGKLQRGRGWPWITLAGLVLGTTPARAQEPQEQEAYEAEPPAPERLAPTPDEPAPVDPPRVSPAPRPRPNPSPIYVPAPTNAAPVPGPAPVSPKPRPVVIKQQLLELRPVVAPEPSAITPAPVSTSALVSSPAAPVSAAAAPAAVPTTPATPTASLPAVPVRYAVKGLTEIEGGVNFSYVRLPKGSSATFALDPAIRRFVSDGLALGGSLELRVIKDGPKSFTILPDAEYNFSFGDGRLFEFVMVGLGVRYVTSGKATATNFVFRPGLGTKLTFGGGLVALGIAVPIAFSDPVEIGLDIMTRYAIFF